MNIHFYLNTEDEIPITSFYELTSNPFKVGDEISLSVDDLYPVEYNKYKPDLVKSLIIANDESRNMFNRKRIKIVRESKHISFKKLNESKLIIEYHCKLI